VGRLLQEALLRTFGAVTRPEPVHYYRNPEAVPGAWRPEEGKEPLEGRGYTVAVPAHRVDELRALLRGPATPSTSGSCISRSEDT